MAILEHGLQAALGGLALLALILQSGHREPDADGDVLPRFLGRIEGARPKPGQGQLQFSGSRSLHQWWFRAHESDVRARRNERAPDP
jgi:hypothetical protein